jgi:hypothetical protein
LRLRLYLISSGAPEIAGYVIEQRTERVMQSDQFQKIIQTFKPVSSQIPNLTVEAVSGASDAAGYAQKFMIAFHLAGLTINGIKPDNVTEMLYPSAATVSSPLMKGLYIGIKADAPPPEAANKFKKLLSDAGFETSFAPWHGIGPNDFVFVDSYR